MRKEKSWTRQVYQQAYAAFRRGFDHDYMAYNQNFGKDIIKAADYSYQAFNHDLSGWRSQSRRKRFYAILVRVYATRGEIPFLPQRS
jgi:hypothetical protein